MVSKFFSVVILLPLLFLATITMAQADAPIDPVVDSSYVTADTVVEWIGIEEAMALQKTTGKKVLFSIYATWCKWCKEQDKVWKNREVAQYINRHYIPVKFNCESKESITYKGNRYNYVNDEKLNVHEFSLFMLNYRQSYPGLVVINEQGNVVTVKNGFINASFAEALLYYYATDAYLSMTFDEFDIDFVGKVLVE